MIRKIEKLTKEKNSNEKSKVSLYKVQDKKTYYDFYSILMSDSFDNNTYNEYKSGFGATPQRGAETISQIEKGFLSHRDSLKNNNLTFDEQWIAKGSGILYEDKMEDTERLKGVQLWLNLPRDIKMATPEYHSINNEYVKELTLNNAVTELLAGEYITKNGNVSKYWPVDYNVIHLSKENKIKIDSTEDKTIIIFSIIGEFKVGDITVEEKTAIKLTNGNFVEIESLANDVEILLLSTYGQRQPMIWGGPIVLNNN